MEDFANHTSEWVEPISTTYRGLTVWELPPDPLGGAADMLNALEAFDLAAMGRDTPHFWHLMVQAKNSPTKIERGTTPTCSSPRCLSKPSSTRLTPPNGRSSSTCNTQPEHTRPATPLFIRGDTTFLVAADFSGALCVSLIQSNYTGFGSGYVVPSVGIGIEARGALFCAPTPTTPTLSNRASAPFPHHYSRVWDKIGVPDTAFGLMGGDMRPQGHVQIVVNLVDFGMNLQEVGDAPRFHHSSPQARS